MLVGGSACGGQATLATPRPDESREVVVGFPPELVDRFAELINVACPPGTKLVERIKRSPGMPDFLELHRHCEKPDGHYKGPIVYLSTNGVSISLDRDGLRYGDSLRIDGTTRPTHARAAAAPTTSARRLPANRRNDAPYSCTGGSCTYDISTASCDIESPRPLEIGTAKRRCELPDTFFAPRRG